MEKVRCKAEIFGIWHNRQCQRTATINGYCKQHEPNLKKERREKSYKEYKDKQDAKYNSIIQAKEALERLREIEKRVNDDTLIESVLREFGIVENCSDIVRELKNKLLGN